MTMKKLLMLGTNSGSVKLLQYAKSQGIYTIVTDYLAPEDSLGKQIADESWMISTNDLDALEAKCRAEGVTAVISGVSDFNVSMAVALNHRLGTPCYCDPETWKYSRNKDLFKAQCRKYGVPTAQEFFVSQEPTEEEIDQIRFPVIVKPTDRSANRGFGYCYAREDFLPALRNARETSESGKVVIEKLLKGKEYTAFYVLADGQASLLDFWSMHAQPGMPENCYSISTTVTDRLRHYLRCNDPQIRALLQGLGYRDGIVWLELMADEDGSLNALEIGHRLSGEMLWLPLSDLRKFNSVGWLVDYAATQREACIPSIQFLAGQRPDGQEFRLPQLLNGLGVLI